MDRLLKLGGIAFVIYLLATKAGSALYNQILVGRPRIKLGKLSVSGIQAILTIPVTNNLPVSAPLDALMGQVMYGVYPVADFAMNSKVVILANQTTELVINTYLDWSKLAGSLIDLVESGQFLNALTVKGHAVSSGIVFPFENKLV